jgi:hypothetical protein
MSSNPALSSKVGGAGSVPATASAGSVFDKRREPTFLLPTQGIAKERTKQLRVAVPPLPASFGSSCSAKLLSATDEFSQDLYSVSMGLLGPPSRRIVSTPVDPGPPPGFPAEPTVAASSADMKKQKSAAATAAASGSEGVHGHTGREPRLMQQYCPMYQPPPSVYSKAPRLSGKQFLTEKPPELEWIHVRCQSLDFRVGMYEPLFCSIAVYRIVALSGKKSSTGIDRAVSGRLSEVFHFDLTPQDVRNRFPSVYSNSEACGVHPSTLCTRFMFGLPPSVLDGNTYLVLQVTKMLQGDPEKVLEPYAKGKAGKRLGADVEEVASRLGAYRQPVAFGAVTLCGGGAGGPPSASRLSRGPNTMVLWRQNSGLSEEGLMMALADYALPESRSKSITPMDGRFMFETELLGRTFQNPLLQSISPQSADGVVNSELGVLLDSELTVMDHLHENLKDIDPSRLVREVALLDGAVLPFSCFRNSLWLTVQALDKFEQRNLALKVELRSFAAGDDSTGVLVEGLYPSEPGPAFVSSRKTVMTYHSRSPQSTDEIKIRLPLELSNSTRLVFTVYHVHVKRKTGGMFGSSSAKVSDEVEVPLGAAHLPLTQHGAGTLIKDGLHTLRVEPTSAAFQPHEDDGGGQSPGPPGSNSSGNGSNANQMLIRVQTRATSSLHSQDPAIAAFLHSQPRPLGLTAGTKAEEPRARLCKLVRAPLAPDLEKSILALPQASEACTYSHMFAVLRGLLRCLAYGTGKEPSLEWADPVGSASAPTEAHTLRGAAFASLVQVIHKSVSEANGQGQDLLQAWLDFVLNEEGPGCVESQQAEGEREAAAISWVSSEVLQHTMGLITDDLLETFVLEATKEHSLEDLQLLWPRPSVLSVLDILADQDGLRAAPPPDLAWETDFGPRKKVVAYGGGIPGSGNSGASPAPPVPANVVDDLLMDDVACGTALMCADDGLPEPPAPSSSSGKDCVTPTTSPPSPPPRAPVVARFQFPPPSPSSSGKDRGQEQEVSGGSTPPRSLEDNYSRRKSRGVRSPKPSPTTGVGGREPVFSTRASPLSSRESVRSVSRIAKQPSVSARSALPDGVRVQLKSVSGDIAGRWYPWLYEVLIAQYLVALGPELETASVEELNLVRLVAKYAGILLGMIWKSMCIRVCDENLPAPVLLDDGTFDRLYCLLVSLSKTAAVDAVSATTINPAAASFVSDLLSVLDAGQVAKLAAGYVDHLPLGSETRLEFLRPLALHDFAVGLNNPALAPLGRHSATSMATPSADGEASQPGSSGPLSPSGFSPPPSLAGLLVSASPPEEHWLSIRIIDACVDAASSEHVHVRRGGISLLRESIAGLAFDERYQDPNSRSRLAAMFLPLIGRLSTRVEILDGLLPRDFRRRELLACTMHVLSEAPEALVRCAWRETAQRFFLAYSRRALDAGASLLNAQSLAPVPECAGADGSPPPFADPLGTNPVDSVAILRLLGLLELCIDTFEFPIEGEGELEDVLVPGLDACHALDSNGQPSESTVRRVATTKWVCHLAQLAVLRSVMSLIDECAPLMSAAGDARAPGAEVDAAPRHLLTQVLHVLLHSLRARQSVLCLDGVFRGTIDILRRFGARLFHSAVGEHLQEWLEVVLVHCNATEPRLRCGARALFSYLLRSTHHYFGSIDVVRVPVLAIFQGLISMVSGELDKEAHNRGKHDGFASRSRRPGSIMGRCQAGPGSPSNAQRKMDVQSVEEAVVSLEPLDSTLRELIEGAADIQFDPAFRLRLCEFMSELLLVKRAYLVKLRYLKYAASTDGTAGLGLDSFNAKYWGGVGTTDMDVESVQELFLKCARTFECTRLPKERADWLFTLAEYHQMHNNDAEQGQCLITIYNSYKRCLPIWDQLWKPRPPAKRELKNLLRRRCTEGEGLTRLRPWHTLGRLKEDIIGHANQVSLCHSILLLSTPSHVCPFSQAGARLGDAGLPILAQGAYSEGLSMARDVRDLKKMAQAHHEMYSFISRAASKEDQGLSGIGSFFRVGFWGGLPEELRGLEFVYR